MHGTDIAAGSLYIAVAVKGPQPGLTLFCQPGQRVMVARKYCDEDLATFASCCKSNAKARLMTSGITIESKDRRGSVSAEHVSELAR